MSTSRVVKAILADDAEALEACIERLEPQVQKCLQKLSLVSVRLSKESALGLGWLLPRIEHTLRQHKLLDEGSRELLAQWQGVSGQQSPVDVDRPLPAVEMSAESVYRMLLAIPLTISMHGGICSKEIRRNVATFAQACLDLLRLKEPPAANRVRQRGRWEAVLHAGDLFLTSMTVLAMVGFIVYAVRWRELQDGPPSIAASQETGSLAVSMPH